MNSFLNAVLHEWAGKKTLNLALDANLDDYLTFEFDGDDNYHISTSSVINLLRVLEPCELFSKYFSKEMFEESTGCTNLEQGEPGFEDTEGTESFTRKMNDLLDALNAKCPAEGIRKNSPQMKHLVFQVIIEFLDMLNSTKEESVNNNMKLFASQMTTESSGDANRFFGVVRSFRGNEGHPTITHFGQIFRLLSLYTPLKMATKGNCTGEADPVLVSVEQSLSAEKLEALSRK
ncbi:hypothetical protein HPB51_015750 [Rhipicephalus microplus]|uniref:Uncharacterized protein n=1 Tax=Rhipicephalus microplus TaxID=6941 RepID=A0A9J6ETG4_RHIMP|nr:hypothetical protein HPB51_015750 [Rhipicephalus microplus]